MDSPNPAIKSACLKLIGDFFNPTNLGEAAIVEKFATENPEWRVRYQAFEILTDGDSI